MPIVKETTKIFHTVPLSHNELKKFFKWLKKQFLRKVRNTVKGIHTHIEVLTGTSDSQSSFSQGVQRCGQNLHSLVGILLQAYTIPLRIFFLTTMVTSWKPQVLLLTEAFQCVPSHKQIRCRFSRATHMLQLSKCWSALLVRNSKIPTCKNLKSPSICGCRSW